MSYDLIEALNNEWRKKTIAQVISLSVGEINVTTLETVTMSTFDMKARLTF